MQTPDTAAIQQSIREALDSGHLTLNDLLAAVAERTPGAEAFTNAAIERYEDGSGDIDIQVDPSVISQSDYGAYVLAWVWVDAAEAGRAADGPGKPAV